MIVIGTHLSSSPSFLHHGCPIYIRRSFALFSTRRCWVPREQPLELAKRWLTKKIYSPLLCMGSTTTRQWWSTATTTMCSDYRSGSLFSFSSSHRFLGIRSPTLHTYASRISVRLYNPRRLIDWVRVRMEDRAEVFSRQRRGRKLSTNKQLAMRVRITRFGWQRLRQNRNGTKKLSWSAGKYRKMMTPTYVSKHYIKNIKDGIPHIQYRIRHAPKNTNPNIKKMVLGRFIPGHFGWCIRIKGRKTLEWYLSCACVCVQKNILKIYTHSTLICNRNIHTTLGNTALYYSMCAASSAKFNRKKYHRTNIHTRLPSKKAKKQTPTRRDCNRPIYIFMYTHTCRYIYLYPLHLSTKVYIDI